MGNPSLGNVRKAVQYDLLIPGGCIHVTATEVT
jgi:hypothetical protein